MHSDFGGNGGGAALWPILVNPITTALFGTDRRDFRVVMIRQRVVTVQGQYAPRPLGGHIREWILGETGIGTH